MSTEPNATENTTTDTAAASSPLSTPDLDVIVSPGSDLTVGGIPATVNRLKMRELIALAKVITNGAGPALSQVKLNTNDSDALGADLVAILVIALPNAVEDFCLFLSQLVVARNADDKARLSAYLRDNPELDELVDVLGVLVTQEKDTLASLAGKLRATLALLNRA